MGILSEGNKAEERNTERFIRGVVMTTEMYLTPLDHLLHSNKSTNDKYKGLNDKVSYKRIDTGQYVDIVPENVSLVIPVILTLLLTAAISKIIILQTIDLYMSL